MTKLRVLLIDDDDGIRELMRKIIEKEGFDAIVAMDGKDGLEIFKKEKPEIIITDLKMPKVDGMEVLHTVKKIAPDTEVIIVTGYGDYDTVITALREGAIDYLKKPIDFKELSISLGRCREKILARKKMEIKPTILILEDDDITREKLVKALSHENFDVFSAGDGEEGLKIFYENKIDVIVTDIKMPKKGGMEVLHEVKKNVQDCEVIVVTGFGDESTAILAMREGALSYLKKPIDLDQMIVTIQKAMETLNMKRSMLYKIRELELTREIIARITGENEIVINLKNRSRKTAREFAQRLLDIIPVGLVVVDRDINIVYVNQHFSKYLEAKPKVFNEALVKQFSVIGINNINFGNLIEVINRIFESKPGEVEIVNASKYAYISVTKIIILEEDIKREAVLLVMRGERTEK